MEERRVVAANQEFYRAFRDRDRVAMERVWAREHLVACLHPGWEPLTGRAAVLESWDAIMASPSSPAVNAGEETVLLEGHTAVVLCAEHIDDVRLVATNVFVLEGDEWKIFHHHASPLSRTRPT